jgi:hypothetical protein
MMAKWSEEIENLALLIENMNLFHAEAQRRRE